jgi:hypothetical protein
LIHLRCCRRWRALDLRRAEGPLDLLRNLQNLDRFRERDAGPHHGKSAIRARGAEPLAHFVIATPPPSCRPEYLLRRCIGPASASGMSVVALAQHTLPVFGLTKWIRAQIKQVTAS